VATIDGKYYREVWEIVGQLRNREYTDSYNPDAYNDRYVLEALDSLIDNLQAFKRICRDGYGVWDRPETNEVWERY
jgi:hypothetical protein